MTFWWRGHVTNLKPYICTALPRCLWPPNLAEWQLMIERPYPWSHMTFWLRDNVANVKPYICFYPIPVATKLNRVVPCGGGIPTSKSRDLLVTWPRDKWICQDGNLGWGTLFTISCGRLTKLPRGHYLLNVFKTSVAILLIILSLL